MVHDAQGTGRRIVNVEHVFEPIGAFRNAHIHPIGAVVLHAAVPRLAEAEDVLIEFIGRIAIRHGHPDVNHVARYARVRQELPEVA